MFCLLIASILYPFTLKSAVLTDCNTVTNIALKINAQGDFNVASERGAVTSEAVKDYDYKYFYAHSDGGFFGGSSTQETTSYRAQDLGSDIACQARGTLMAEKDIHFKAGQLTAKDLTIASKSGKVKLEAGEEKDFYHNFEESSGLLTTTTTDEGHDRTTKQPVMVTAGNLQIPSPAEVDYKVGFGKQIREALAGRKDIDWQAVRDNYHAWFEHKTTLNGPAKLLVACVLTVATQGMGTEWLTAHGLAESSAIKTAIGAGIDAVAASAGTGLASNLGDIGKTFDELTSADFVKNVVSTMLTAGLSQSLSSSLQLPDAPKTFTESLKKNTTHGLVQTGVDSAISGGKVGKNLVQNMTTSAVDAGSAQIAHTIGDAKAAGTLNSITHKTAHGALAIAGAKLTGRDPVGAAIGAVVAETAAEALHKDGKDPETTAKQARIIGDVAAFIASKDVASADETGSNAVENNWLEHDAIPSVDELEKHADKSLLEIGLAYNQASIEEGVKETQLWNEASTTMAPYAAAGVGMVVAPTLTSGYLTTQSVARWTGTYAGGGMQAVTQEFRDHPVASTVDVATTGMLGVGFAKSITKVPQIVEAGQGAYKHHKVVRRLKGNIKRGKKYELHESNSLRQNMPIFENQITLEIKGIRTRIDGIGITNKGQIKLFEFKSSPTAPLTKNQKKAFPLIEQNGAKIIGTGKGIFVPGLKLPPTQVEVIRPNK